MLALLMIVSLVGCGKKRREPIKLTLSTEDSEAILKAAGVALPSIEEAAGARTIVKWYAWYDPMQNYSDAEVINTGFWTFQEKYEGALEYVECTYAERNEQLAALLVSDDAPDLTPCGTSNTAVYPMNCLNGMYQPIDQWVDYENNPLWSGLKDAAEYFTLRGEHYAILTDLDYKSVIPYNKRVIDEWGFDDPAELYANDEWTWDRYAEMCYEFTDGDQNRYALDGWYVVNSLCEESTGRYIIQRDEDGNFYANLDDPLIEAAENLIYDLVKAGCTYHEGNNYWANRNNAEYGAGVKSGDCLFWPCDRSGFTHPVEEIEAVWGSITDNEIMFVPLPRNPQGDGIYYLNTVPTGYMIVSGAKNPEGAVLLASCNRFKIMDPTVVNIDEKQLKEKYLWTDDMLDMNRECKEIASTNVRMYYTGNLPQNLQDAYNAIDWGIHRSGAANTWAQLKEANGEKIQFYLEEVNDLVNNA